jgi:hypothetical protein
VNGRFSVEDFPTALASDLWSIDAYIDNFIVLTRPEFKPSDIIYRLPARRMLSQSLVVDTPEAVADALLDKVVLEMDHDRPRAHEYLQRAIAAHPDKRAMFMQIQLLEAYMNAAEAPPYRLALQGEQQYRADFISDCMTTECDAAFLFEYFYGLGNVLAKMRPLDTHVNVADTWLSLAEKAFDAAISRRPNDDSPYVGRYNVQYAGQLYSDGMETIERFFASNRHDVSADTAKVLLSGWHDGLDGLAAYQEVDRVGYVTRMSADPDMSQAWKSFGCAASRFAAHMGPQQDDLMWRKIAAAVELSNEITGATEDGC